MMKGEMEVGVGALGVGGGVVEKRSQRVLGRAVLQQFTSDESFMDSLVGINRAKNRVVSAASKGVDTSHV